MEVKEKIIVSPHPSSLFNECLQFVAGVSSIGKLQATISFRSPQEQQDCRQNTIPPGPVFCLLIGFLLSTTHACKSKLYSMSQLVSQNNIHLVIIRMEFTYYCHGFLICMNLSHTNTIFQVHSLIFCLKLIIFRKVLSKSFNNRKLYQIKGASTRAVFLSSSFYIF